MSPGEFLVYDYYIYFHSGPCSLIVLKRRILKPRIHDLVSCKRGLSLITKHIDSRQKFSSLPLWVKRRPQAEQNLKAAGEKKRHSMYTLTM